VPAPFPGVDPYIEGQVWQDFHLRLIAVISELLMPSLRPRYLVRVEERIYLEHETTGLTRHIQPDLLLVDSGGDRSGTGGAVLSAIEPVNITLPIPEEVRERYLTLRVRDTLDVVTIIEILSPTNKRPGPGSDGLASYLAKREEILLTRTNLVELDLLRGGSRLPSENPLPPADFYAIVSRGSDRPNAVAYPWTLHHALPAIPIPLANGDPDLTLNLQQAYTTVYDRAGYDYSLDYAKPPSPPLVDADMAWANRLARQT